MYRELYFAIDPINLALSVKGKVVIVIGVGGGLGGVSSLNVSLVI